MLLPGWHSSSLIKLSS